MTDRALDIYLGAEAARRIAADGWHSGLFDRLLGASGGPKWLILSQLDRLLFGDFLPARRERPLSAIGSSIGAWRHACLAQADPVAAIDRFEAVYLGWEYSDRPDVTEVSAASYAILDVLLEGGACRLVDHPWLHSYIVTARGRGPAGARHRAALAPALAGAAIANAVHRKLLPGLFQRVLFASAQAPPLALGDFSTRQLPLVEETVRPALHASGSIPFVLAGERDIAGAPPGHYWDGGIIDYHFDPAAYADAGLLLYPHFRKDLTTGWFDKLLPWRRQRQPLLEQLVLLCPSDRFIASLPLGKIPDRSDFQHLGEAERRRYWRECSVRGRELAEDFAAQLRAADPLAGTRRLEA